MPRSESCLEQAVRDGPAPFSCSASKVDRVAGVVAEAAAVLLERPRDHESGRRQTPLAEVDVAMGLDSVPLLPRSRSDRLPGYHRVAEPVSRAVNVMYMWST